MILLSEQVFSCNKETPSEWGFSFCSMDNLPVLDDLIIWSWETACRAHKPHQFKVLRVLTLSKHLSSQKIGFSCMFQAVMMPMRLTFFIIQRCSHNLDTLALFLLESATFCICFAIRYNACQQNHLTVTYVFVSPWPWPGRHTAGAQGSPWGTH